MDNGLNNWCCNNSLTQCGRKWQEESFVKADLKRRLKGKKPITMERSHRKAPKVTLEHYTTYKFTFLKNICMKFSTPLKNPTLI